MKNSILITILVFVFFTARSQQVALHKGTGVQFFEGSGGLTSAIAASSTGDTIYLPGGSFSSPGNIDKGIVIYGTGHYPDYTDITGKTFITGHLTLKDNADNFHLEGLEITGNLSMSYGESVNNVTVIRCRMVNFEALGDWNTPTSENTALIGNVINTIYLANCKTALVANNIIRYGIDHTHGNLIKNNIFLGKLTSGYYENFRGNNNNIHNNIFLVHGSYGMTNGSGNIYYNNIMAFPSPAYGTAATTLNNYTGLDPANIFVEQSGQDFIYTHDYNLKTPTSYPGTDATQVGIFGGTFPYKEGAIPVIPHFTLKDISPETNSSGQLTIRIKVKAQDNW